MRFLVCERFRHAAALTRILGEEAFFWAITELIRREPTSEEFSAVVRLMDDPSAYRACAIVLPSLIHQEIAKVVLTKLTLSESHMGIFDESPLNHPHREAVVEALFDRDGPLNSLSSTIVLAYAMRLIDQVTYDNANTIRRIRNVFAHAVVPVTFDTPEIIAECRRLRVREPERWSDSRMRFLEACSEIIMSCVEREKTLAINNISRISRSFDAHIFRKLRKAGRKYGVSTAEISAAIESLRKTHARPRSPQTRSRLRTRQSRKPQPQS